MKKIIFLMILVVCLTSSVWANGYKVSVDSHLLRNTSGVFYGGVVYVPLKPVSEKIKAKMTFDKSACKVTVMRKTEKTVFYLGKNKVYSSGTEKIVPRGAVLSEGKIYLPAALLNNMGCSYRVDMKRRYIFIRSKYTPSSPDEIDVIDDIK